MNGWGGEWVWQWECGRWHNNYVDVSWQPFQPLRRHFVTFIITIITRSSSALSQRLLKLRFTCHPQSRLLCLPPPFLSLSLPSFRCLLLPLESSGNGNCVNKVHTPSMLLQLKSAARSLPVSFSLPLQSHLVLSSSRVVS